jgi:hypothetical protein
MSRKLQIVRCTVSGYTEDQGLPKPKRANRKKLRTRAHVLADLGVNYVERQVLMRGWSADRSEHDYGIDLFLSTYTVDGEIENGRILLQVKATERVRLLADQNSISFPIDRRDLQHWIGEPAPVILILYDAASDQAFWLYIQEYFENQRGIDLATAPGKVTVRIPARNVLNQISLDAFADYRNRVLTQIDERIHHG